MDHWDLLSDMPYSTKADSQRGRLRGGRRSGRSTYKSCTGRCGMCSMDGGSSKSAVRLRKKRYGSALHLDYVYSGSSSGAVLVEQIHLSQPSRIHVIAVNRKCFYR